jgi:hypothetical protein
MMRIPTSFIIAALLRLDSSIGPKKLNQPMSINFILLMLKKGARVKVKVSVRIRFKVSAYRLHDVRATIAELDCF